MLTETATKKDFAIFRCSLEKTLFPEFEMQLTKFMKYFELRI